MATKEENYLQQITELVHDDNTIVTATIFSSTARIKVSEAQNLLDKYVESDKNVSCTYILTGCTNNGICILLSKGNELETKKALFKTVTSQHVYSIQKSDTDIITLTNTEPFAMSTSSEPLLGSIVSNKAVKRKLKKKVNISSETNVIKQEKQKPEDKSKPEQAKVKDGENKINKSKSNGIANFCVSGNNTNKIKPVISNKSKQKNMMSNFFGKSQKVETNGDSKKESSASTDLKNGLDGTIVEPEIMDVDDDDEQPNKDNTENTPEIIEEKSVESKTKESDTTKTRKKTKKRKKNTESSQPSKKRKRIVETQDSDSDIFASSESEVEVVPDIHFSDENEDLEEKKIISSPQPQKSRRMKQVTEEFMDEDGYMNTVQKYVMISDNEEENEQKPINIPEKVEESIKLKEIVPVSNKNEKSSPPKKSNKNGKAKMTKVSQNQASIMDFFKRN